MKLVICEKPSVGALVAAALGVTGKKDGYIEGNGYVISWCIGHLVQLSEAAAYGEQYKKWSYDSLPILPQEWQYTVAADKGKQFKILKDLMHRADISEVVNACDAGREGELIFRFVYHQAGCKKPFTRLWISSMENEAIRSGFDNLKDGREYDALYHSALCRAKADWLIGINATRLFSCLYGKTLNVGRVQTPTLKMLVDRDAAITTFKKEKYYHVRLSLSGAEAASEKLSDRSEADRLKAACEALKAYDDSIYPWGIDMTTDEGQAAFAYYTWNNGGGFVDDEGNWTLNSEQNVEAIQYAIDLVNSGYTNTDPANDTRYDLQDMFGAGKVAMLIAPNSLPTYIATGGNEVNYGVASIPSNTGESVSAGVMDRFMCFDNDYSDDEKAAISTFFDYFYDDARYTEWVDMEGFLPATKSGGEALAAANEDMASWIDILDSCKFYPTAKAEWADVKQGVINVEQNALLGGDVQELLDDLQAEIAG